MTYGQSICNLITFFFLFSLENPDWNKPRYLTKIPCGFDFNCGKNQKCMKTKDDKKKYCFIKKCRAVRDCLDVGHPWNYSSRYHAAECVKGRCVYKLQAKREICWLE